MCKIRRCPACKRTLKQAIDEQISFQRICPLEHCVFKVEIQQAIEEKNGNPLFVSKYCTQCGKPYNNSTSKFCIYCGEKRSK
jgi:hypothetical protein